MSGGVDRCPRAAAALRGAIAVYPGPRELFVDVDTEAQESHFAKAYGLLCSIGLVEYARKTPSISAEPHHWHYRVYLTRDVRDTAERLLLQAICGSDCMRELLSYARLIKGDYPESDVVAFFEAPGGEFDTEAAP